MKLAGKIALVTGAGRGIGKGCAIELAKAGADLVLNERPGSPDIEITAEEVRSLGRKCEVVEANVFSREGCEELVATAIAKVSRIDILISNPAFSRRGPFLEYSPELFEQTIQGTLTSGYHMSQLVAREMVKQGDGGKIVFISSVHGEMPISGSFAYGAAKAGLNHMMRSIAVELSEYGINVNAIEPGWIDTPGEHVAFSEETIEAEGRKLPFRRLGRSDEIGKAAAFLSSSDADYITGTVLPVDGLFRFRHCLPEKTPQPKDAQ
ncbi:SDR family NAD(P)-dependent oxidoreductase [Thalassoglobus sp.]|uniref:SDR family NAD(P)-dependent oxidoreductase n=1 Tax=Thalassoglobus sp. TaxID=2795869 RepID=UPI003AA7F349